MGSFDPDSFGRLHAARRVEYSLRIHAQFGQSVVFPHPVWLERPFRLFDPVLTVEPVDERERAVGMIPGPCSSRRVALPLEADGKSALTFLAGLSGCTAPVRWKFFANRTQRSFFLSANPKDIGFVAAQWSSAFPTGWVGEQPAAIPWPKSFDGLALFDVFPRSSYQCACQLLAPWSHIPRLCDSLEKDEFLFFRLEFVRAQGSWRQNIAWMLGAEKALGQRSPIDRTLVPKSVDEPLFLASLMFGTTSPAAAQGLERMVGLFSSEGKPFGVRTMQEYAVLKLAGLRRMIVEQLSHATGFFATSSELAPVLTPPDSTVPGSERLLFVRGLPVPESLRGPGLFLGTNTYCGVETPVYQPLGRRNFSSVIFGSSGMGKSSAMVHHILSLAEAGLGCAVLDPHRSMVFELLGLLKGIPEEQVIVADFDDDRPVAYNPLDCQDEDDYGRLTTEYAQSFRPLFDASFPRMQHYLGMGIYALLVLHANFSTLPVLFAKTPEGEGLRRQVISKVKNEAVRRFFQDEFPNRRAETFEPLLSRFTSFFLDDQTLRTFSQVENKVDIAAAMNQGKIVFIAPPASPDPAAPLGGCMIAQARNAAMRRVGTPLAEKRFTFFIDESHRFLSSGKILQSIIDETAKGGLGVVLAHQETSQLPTDLLKTVLSMPNIFVFGVNPQDAKLLSPLFNGRVTAEALAGQGTGSVYGRIGQEIVHFHSPAPPTHYDPAVAERIIRYSKEHYYTKPNTTTVISPGRHRRVIDTLEDA